MIQLVDDSVPLSPRELLALTPKEAALLEALRRLFAAIQPAADAGERDPDRHRPCYIPEDRHDAYLGAKGLYLELRDFQAEGRK